MSLTRLDLGGCFNWPVHAVAMLPRLEVLKFGDAFNQPIDEVGEQFGYPRLGIRARNPTSIRVWCIRRM